MAGLSDIHHDLCLALVLWNGVDPILKERMFGLTGSQGNHGEDVKEYWWYLDGLPSHAWLRWRYHYPQEPFPYQWLIDENGRRSRDEPEFELMDTGVLIRDGTGPSMSRTRKPQLQRFWPRSRSRTMPPKLPHSLCCLRCGFATPGGSGGKSH
jgi:hypothetical protein